MDMTTPTKHECWCLHFLVDADRPEGRFYYYTRELDARRHFDRAAALDADIRLFRMMEV